MNKGQEARATPSHHQAIAQASIPTSTIRDCSSTPSRWIRPRPDPRLQFFRNYFSSHRRCQDFDSQGIRVASLYSAQPRSRVADHLSTPALGFPTPPRNDEQPDPIISACHPRSVFGKRRRGKASTTASRCRLLLALQSPGSPPSAPCSATSTSPRSQRNLSRMTSISRACKTR